MANTLKLDSLESIVEFLDSNPAGFLATLGTCGNPRVRPVQSALLYDGKIYFATSTKKNLYKHIQNHAGIEYCSCNSEGVFLRLRGQARISQDEGARKAMLEKYPLVAQIYGSADNEEFAVFYLQNISAQIQDTQNNTAQFKEK
ncbi:pyridoxamine 5'-phosphate oxidase [Helicobacter sp. MIT 00-7814]|uniref:pyridoxamine 5'-phosphate oxidase family protein n=1 Tax=unclassified Helicobacter TaxID=2593540 RepID=UPI000E1FACB7|nr:MULTISPECIES: pyridoxamine 5'-phosphate oxidase family protein [unclassified Helicobacter]RDU52152.1 pyridoxamine 5'-phosphate oxidase [Helicobacter sp. MIT 99-10781]RDU52543.1 pyridoxamine 5'-phosphate oxidase [Helicobacter sp. MIT 00-7814]